MSAISEFQVDFMIVVNTESWFRDICYQFNRFPGWFQKRCFKGIINGFPSKRRKGFFFLIRVLYFFHLFSFRTNLPYQHKHTHSHMPTHTKATPTAPDTCSIRSYQKTITRTTKINKKNTEQQQEENEDGGNGYRKEIVNTDVFFSFVKMHF